MKRKHKFILVIVFAEMLLLFYSSFQEYSPLDVAEMKAEVQKTRQPISQNTLIAELEKVPFIAEKSSNTSMFSKASNGRKIIKDTFYTVNTFASIAPTKCYFGSREKYDDNSFVFDKLVEETPEMPIPNKPLPYLSTLKDTNGSCGNKTVSEEERVSIFLEEYYSVQNP